MNKHTGERPFLDLRMSQFKHIHGDLVVWGTWYGAENAGRQPCLVLTKLNGRKGSFVPCIVPIELAYRWAENDPALVPSLSGLIADFAINLYGGMQSSFTLKRIFLAIQDHIQELINMPPVPKNEDRYVAADGFITNRETGAVTELEITDRG